jgi:cytochrome c oxidase assembly protein subunit 15
MKKWMRRLSRLEVVLIFLVIIAGSVVRMTGSGMGCPDWPKCFGYLIPPTERSTLEWQPQREFDKGNIIIIDEALFEARQSFTSSNKYNTANWEKYTRHDYAIFNAKHTWIEYINRLLGALSGLPMLLLVILSAFLFKEDKRLLLLSLAGLFMLGFEAWLGKLVVDGNLIPGSITIHMIGALLIVAILLVLNGLLTSSKFNTVYYTSVFKNLMVVALGLTLIQIVLGTQVREQIDSFGKMGVARTDWVSHLDITFYIHRSFSLAILGVNLWLWYKNRKQQLGFWQLNAVLLVLGVELVVGIILAYTDVPAWAQPIHLLLGALLFALQWQALVHFAFADKKRVVPLN